jgi:hypothetical protein
MGKDICPLCDKEVGFFKTKWNRTDFRADLKGKRIHVGCVQKLLDSEPLCSHCAFFREYEEPFLDSTITVRRCGKLDFELTSLKYNQAKQCVHYIHKEEYREKALKGEIVPSMVLKTCPYRKTQYDLQKASVCPKCGAS